MIVLCWFLRHNSYNGFRLEELEALASLEGVTSASLWSGCQRPDSHSENQFVFVNVPDEAVCHALMKRSLLIKAFIEVWAEGETYEAVLQELQGRRMPDFRKWVNADRTWAFKVGAFGKCLSSDEQRRKMTFFASLFKGNEKVDLENPATTLVVAEEWTHTEQLQAPRRIFFGRQICGKTKEHPFWWKYRLPVRPVLGPTSLDCELAFLMCNQGLVGPDHVVLDPFVGTGSVLIAAAHYGAFCVGSDIDIRVLKGYGVSYMNPHLSLENKKTDIFRNFDEYGLCRPEIIRCDNAAWVWRLPYEERAFSKLDELPQLPQQGDSEDPGAVRPAYLTRNLRGGKPWVDCIMTDPPYGIRAGARQSGHLKKYKRNEHTRSNEDRLTYIPPTVVYSSRALVSDLLNLSSRLLVDGGRLVFLLPVELSTAKEDIGSLSHQDLELVSTSLQEVSGGMGRVLVTMSRKARCSAA
ncbi:tRNA guanosine-2-o-methyltransferase trm11-like related protein [Cyclospora cayetanensis]|uniref:tRNA guanosine-2-o-methyltransferase trm11-like related protein n=1 Tax=Cyclospora cayetanensis TaxID=88456 RepID=A0A1D3CZM4_9EIME|nr:tRNA guanosine-2-o-methyltransferase trm11-like related protein [Cyclospora cayetanensis]